MAYIGGDIPSLYYDCPSMATDCLGGIITEEEGVDHRDVSTAIPPSVTVGDSTEANHNQPLGYTAPGL